jgi:hypothetical protein
MAIALSVLPFTLLSDEMEGQTTQATRKKGKWKDRQHNGHQKEE